MAEDKSKGYMDGSFYYSVALPKGMGDKTKYLKDDYMLINSAMPTDATNETTLKVQRKLISLGYLDPGDDDGYRGDATIGAIKRYNNNVAGAVMWKTITDFKDNLFDFFDGEE
tara:strand:+ start:183 stop:521 length:339 start_codon:yes stop_codon:yes gene_type:complete